MATYTNITVNGVELPNPAFNAVTLSSNKVWSADTGRDATGKMVGTLLGVKAKIEMKFPYLPPSEVARIKAAVDNVSFATLSFNDEAGVRVTKEVYFGDLKTSVYSWANGIQLEQVTISAIER